MPSASPQEVTQLLQAWSRGDSSALEMLTPLVYRELHRLAHRYMDFENPGHTLQTTALVNEAYLRLVSNRASWQNRAHFFAISAQLMRQILVDFARSRHQLKRGGQIWPAISRSGTRLAYEQRTIDTNIWRLSLSGPGVTESPPVRFIASTRSDTAPQYSPDGRRIGFESDRSGVWCIWAINADGSNAVELFSRPGAAWDRELAA